MGKTFVEQVSDFYRARNLDDDTLTLCQPIIKITPGLLGQILDDRSFRPTYDIEAAGYCSLAIAESYRRTLDLKHDLGGIFTDPAIKGNLYIFGEKDTNMDPSNAQIIATSGPEQPYAFCLPEGDRSVAHLTGISKTQWGKSRNLAGLILRITQLANPENEVLNPKTNN